MAKLAVVFFAVMVASVACKPQSINEKTALEEAKENCKHSVNSAINELRDSVSSINRNRTDDDKADHLTLNFAFKVAEFLKVFKTIKAAESMEVSEELYTPKGKKINCSPDIAKQVQNILNIDDESTLPEI